MIGAALALGTLIAVPVLLACGIRPRSWQAQVERATLATWDDVAAGRPSAGARTDAEAAARPVTIELDAPIPTPEVGTVAFPGYLLPGDEREEARRAGS